MVLLGKKTRRNINIIESKKSQMLCEMINHPAWQAKKSLSELESLLSEEAPFTYALSQGLEKYHFFLSYVSAEGLVKYKNVRIVLINGNWNWKNGCVVTYEAIHQLIPNCLGCSSTICKALDS